MNCVICKREKTPEVPLLKCGCYLCPECYCKQKTNGIYHCTIHKIELKRKGR